MHMKYALMLMSAAVLALAHDSPQTACADFTVASARCSTVTVLENRTTGTGRSIALRVAVLPAAGTSHAPDPIFVLAGGPGQAATSLARNPAALRVAHGDRRDLVFVDQRGTGGSNPIQCDFYPEDDYARGRFAPFMAVDTVRRCRRQLESKADLAQYTTAASVEDLEAVRKALGYERINLAGGSYGTRLAMEYVRAYGSRVRTVQLDGAVPPSLRMPAGFGRAAQHALDGIIAECAATPPCAAAYPQLENEVRRVFKRLALTPVVTRLTGQAAPIAMTRDNVAEAVRYLSYSSRDASRIPMLLHSADAGDFTGIAEFLRRYRAGDLFHGLYLSVTCTEDVPFLPKDAEASDQSTYLGSYRIREQRAACAEWPRGTVPAFHGEPVRSSVPVLIATGSLDPVTPAAHGDLVARTLPNSLHLKIPSGAHGLAGLRGLDCLDGMRRDFVDRGSVAGLDSACVSRITRPGFDIVVRREVP
jgi:pimeloyl-ACP methyl ester carboxylesterase